MSENSNIDSIFCSAIEIESPEERDLFVQQACGDDKQLHGQILRLLQAHFHGGSILDSPANGLTATINPRVTEQPGTVIGPFKLLQQIGEGGMGVVFMAEQTEPFQRTVALKIIKPGMDTRQVIARFEAERQALAMMDHPNIAKVLDAGTTDTGGPYFVMDLVKGVPITKYCDEMQLSLRERLELFMQVCQAVQHAHQKGIIHRDIKPTNVIVAEYDNHAVPKVIDFGVAKATAQKLTERTMFTEFGQVIGTVEYMSPEQAKLNQLDIDTRSDIYSLGVLLYELLAGSTPFEQKRLREAAFDEALRIIREEEPPKPSTKLSSSDTLPSIAANRHTEPARLSKDVRGELDWIVMKCLEKDRNRRYETANGMARDIERYLADEPVLARPTTQLYRLKKFIHRNRVGVTVGSSVAIALVASLALASIGFVQARRQARIAAANAERATEAKGSAEAALIEKSVALEEKGEALQLAEEKELLQRRRFYASQMNLAQQALAAGDPARVLDLLDQQRPLAGETDLRGFEWYYLWREIHPSLRHTMLCPGTVGHWALAVSPDGKTVAINDLSAEHGNHVKLFDTDSGKLRATISDLPAQIATLTFSPDGSSLAGGAFDQYLFVWNIPTGRQIAQAKVPGWIVRACGFSPDGKHLVAGADHGAVHIYDAATLKVVAQLKSHAADAPLSNAFYSPDGSKVITSAAWGSEGIVTRIHDVRKQPPEVINELTNFRATDISPDGQRLVGASQNEMSLWDTVERKYIWQQPSSHPGKIMDVKFAQNGMFIISAGGDDRVVIIWNLAERIEVTRVPHPDELQVVAFARSDRGIWASLSDDGTAKIWDFTPRPEQGKIGKNTYCQTMVARPDGRSVLFGSEFPAEIWDVKTETQLKSSSAATHVRSISADGRWLASVERVVPEAELRVTVWDLTTGKPRHALAMPDSKGRNIVRISPDGKFLATSSNTDQPILLWDLSRAPTEPPVPDSIRFFSPPNLCGALDFVFSPDSRLLAVAYQFGFVNLYNLETRRHIPLPLSGNAPWASRVAFSNDGKLLAAGDNVGMVSILDTEQGEVIASLPGHEATISALAFFPDGLTLAVGSLDTIRLWDVHSNQERMTLRLAADPVAPQTVFVDEIVVTQDGRTLVSHHSNATVQIWNAADELADVAIQPRAQFKRPTAAVNDPHVYTRRAIFLTSIGKWEPALANWKKAEELGVHWDQALITQFMQALPGEIDSDDWRAPDAVRRLREYVVSHFLSRQDASALNLFAWGIVRMDVPSPATLELAVPAAEKAVSIAPDDGASVNTLGAAYYRAGQWERAIEMLEKSMTLRNGGDAFDWFFLAMAYWQLGYKDEARQWYDKAIAWMEENARQNEELHRFRAEAAELLGIKQSQPSTDKDPVDD